MLMRFQGSEWAEVGRIEVWTSPTIGRGAIVGSGARIAGDAVIPPGENRSGRCPEMSPIEVILANGTRAVLGLLAGRNGSAPAFFQQGCREWLRGFTYRNTGHGTHDEVPACRNPWDPGPPKLTDVKDDVTWASCWRTKPVPNREVEPSSQAVGRVTIQRLDRTVQSSVPPHRLAMPIYMWDSMWDAHITIIGNCMVSSHLLYVPVRIGNPPRGEFEVLPHGPSSPGSTFAPWPRSASVEGPATMGQSPPRASQGSDSTTSGRSACFRTRATRVSASRSTG